MTFHARPRRWRPDHAASKDARIFASSDLKTEAVPWSAEALRLSRSVGSVYYVFII